MSLQGLKPVVDILVDLVLGIAVALLELAFELFAAALDDVEIVVGELAPFSLAEPLNCFQLPSMRFQSMIVSC
jgi:hypothetical protein